MDTYSRPKYTELDPTIMISIVFPIFFGLILGDVGYGALLLVLCLGLRKFLKGEEGQQLLAVLRNASISSIFFGVLYSEFLGFPCPWPYLLPSRHLNIGGEGGAWSQYPGPDDDGYLDRYRAYHPRQDAGDRQPCTPGSRVHTGSKQSSQMSAGSW